MDVSLSDALPRGAVPDLGVDGIIELERLENVLYVSRPALAEEGGTVGLFRLTSNLSEAQRVRVTFGRTSATSIVVVRGLMEGDRVVLSDMSASDGFDRIRLR